MSNTSDTKLKPCPFCGSRLTTMTMLEGSRWIMCTACKGEGPWASSDEDAIEAWNRRSPVEVGVTIKGVTVLDKKALEAAQWAFAHEAENSDVSQQDCITAAIRYYLAVTSEDDAPTESILRPLADREKSADPFDQAQEKRRHAAALIADAEVLEQLAYDTADYCGGGEP